MLRGNVSSPGMAYELLARVFVTGPTAQVSCSEVASGTGVTNATLDVAGAQEAWVTWVGETEYDMDAGDASHGFSFRKANGLSSADLLARLDAAAPNLTASSTTYDDLLNTHIASYTSSLGGFALSLGQSPNLSLSTDELKANYQTDVGDPYLEWVLFNFGRYLLASSAPGTLPANLQGKWASDISNAWSAGMSSFVSSLREGYR